MSIIVPITTLAPEPYELLRDIPVVVQADGDSFVATFYDANLSMSGDTEAEAIALLKDSMIALFELFQREKKLGKGMAMQRAVLFEVMRKKVIPCRPSTKRTRKPSPK